MNTTDAMSFINTDAIIDSKGEIADIIDISDFIDDCKAYGVKFDGSVDDRKACWKVSRVGRTGLFNRKTRSDIWAQVSSLPDTTEKAIETAILNRIAMANNGHTLISNFNLTHISTINTMIVDGKLTYVSVYGLHDSVKAAS